MILCDYGYFDASTFNFTRLIRIKIFKNEGTAWANRAFYSMTRSGIRGKIYNLENNEIVEEKLDNNFIFREDVNNDVYMLRVTLPNVKEGSIIDYEYTFTGLPYEWRFQETIPVRWSEVIIEPTNVVLFQLRFVGSELLHVQTDSRWVAKDMKPFKTEPYMNSIENYLTKIEFDIQTINAPGFFKNYAATWKSVGDYLLDYLFFGVAINSSHYLNDIAKEIKTSFPAKTDQIKAAFEFVKQVKWNESQRVTTSVELLREVLRDKTGNSADINLMLLQLLKEMKIEAWPVVISTRDNGILSPADPSIYKLNHVIVQAKDEGKTYLMDATEEYNPFDLLPEKCLNWFGCLVKKEASEWIDIETIKKDKQLTYYNLSLTEDLVLTGKIDHLYSDYAAYNFRKKYDSFSSRKQYLFDLTNNSPGLAITNSVIKNIDSLSFPVEDSYEVTIKNQIEKIGNEYFIYPALYERTTENPFKLDEREYPIDFGYKTEKNLIVNITMPENCKIVEIPEAMKIELPDGGGYFTIQCSMAGNICMYNYKFLINKEVFLPTQYPVVREFFNQVIKAHEKPIIFQM
jgi:hypothetical protein